MATTSNLSYTPKQPDHPNYSSKQPALGVTLGDKSEPMETINQQYYNQK